MDRLPPAPTLFDQPRARSTDPWTSHAAAVSLGLDLRESQRAVYDCLAIYGPAHDEAWIEHYRADGGFVRQSVSGLRSRRNELVALGHVVDTGRTELTESGRHSIVWRVA